MASSDGVKEIRLVIIGKTGSGKSSTGNSILGEEKFPPVRGWLSGTAKCDWNEATRNGVRIQITDTPGVCDADRTSEDVQLEIAKSIATVTPGPHAVLVVLKAGERFTKEESQAYDELKQLFGDDITSFMIVVFTGVDLLERSGLDLASAMQRAPPKVVQIMREAGNRYIGFNNEASWDERIQQGDTLLAMVTRMLSENGGRYYSSDLMVEFEGWIWVEMGRISTREEVKREIVEEKPRRLARIRNLLQKLRAIFRTKRKEKDDNNVRKGEERGCTLL